MKATNVLSAESTFDVFLAHNNEDKSSVEAISQELKRRGLKPWLDNEQIPPGRWFQDVIQKAIHSARTIAIIIGPKGLGRWQAVELRTVISQCVERGVPIIPVLLPGVIDVPPELLFLRELNWVRFRESVGESEALDNLVWGITGERLAESYIVSYYSGYLFQGSRDEGVARQSIINGLNDV